MNHYQQQYYSRATPLMSGPPVPSFYAARQNVEQASQPTTAAHLQSRSNVHGYRQYTAPPRHPAQQARLAGGQQHQRHSSSRHGPSQPQVQRRQLASPQGQYGQVQYPYQSPYAQVQQPVLSHTQPQPQPQPQPAYSRPQQFTARPQSMFGSPFPMLPRGQPTPAQAFALYEAYNARTQRAAAATQPQSQPQTQVQHHYQPQLPPLQQAQVPSYSSSFTQNQHGQYSVSPQENGPPQVPSSSAPPVPPGSIPSQQHPQPQQVAPTVVGRRPLPQPGQSRPRPVSMPPQAQFQGSSFQVNEFGHSPSSSAENILPQTSFGTEKLPPPSLRPSSPLLLRSRSPSVSSSSAPVPFSSGIPSLPNVQPAERIDGPGYSSSSFISNLLPQSSFGSAPVSLPSLRPVSPFSAPLFAEHVSSAFVPVSSSSTVPDAPNAQLGGSQSPDKVPSPAETTMQRTPTKPRALPQSPTAPPDLSQLHQRRSQINTGPPSFQPPQLAAFSTASPQVAPQAPLPPHSGNSEAKDDDDRLSVASQESKQSNQATSSPQYGILDLPRRKSQVFSMKAGPSSPQYGIKDLPVRTKSVVDRRKAWERDEHSMNEATPRSRSKPVSPTKRSNTSAPVITQKSTTTAVPPRSPQPQVPKQRRGLPMPVVRQPQPSRTERTPSWTLPTADLDKIAGAGEQKTSMALRFAKMSLEEEKANSKQARTPSTVLQTQTQLQKSSVQSSTSRTSSPTKSHPLSSRTPRRSVNIDLNLDDAPPPSLRRTPSPSASTASSSVPSIPLIKTPDDVQQSAVPVIPKISLRGDPGFDDIPSKPPSPQASIPTINLPGDDYAGDSGPMVLVSAPSPMIKVDSVSMPVILDDLSSSPSKSRSGGLPRPPSGSASTASETTISSSNVRSRGGGLVCGGCGEGILGRIVSAMGLRWHPQCFKCCQCGEQLEHVSSYEHDGKPYCHLDYHELFAPQCYTCKTPIVDERFITLDDPALGKRTYHEQHFFCAECGDPFLAPSVARASKRPGPNEISIKGDGAFDVAVDEDGLEVGFTVFRGHPYCEACHVRLRAPKCKGCKKSIRDGMRAVEALGGKWCYECFVCAGCEKPFEEPSFFQRDKKPFCEHCFSVILRNEI